MNKIKKILIVLLAVLICFPIAVYAEEGHIILDDYSTYLDEDAYQEMNDDLQHIEDDYDIGIYFVYDKEITDTMDGINAYAQKFLDSHSYASNNVVLVISDSYYLIVANGNMSKLVIDNENSLWDAYALADTYEGGIRAYYQKVVNLINSQIYQSDVPQREGDALVNDYASLLSASERERLSSKLKQISDRYGIDVAVVTTNSLGKLDAQDYADDFYDYNHFKKDGILLLISMATSEMFISTAGKGYEYMTDYGIDYIYDEIGPKLSAGRYYDAFDTFADYSSDFIEDGINGDIFDHYTPAPSRSSSFGIVNIGISAFIALIVSLITMAVLKGQMKNVHTERFAGNYIVDGSFILTGVSDMLVDRRVTRTRRTRSNPASGNRPGGSVGGGSSIHTSSSGTSHGGHGGHF